MQDIEMVCLTTIDYDLTEDGFFIVPCLIE